jgi:Cdc6-like AAA superfamily ATPase
MQGLTQAWGIYSQEDAYEVIEWIQKGGHRVAFNAIAPYINITDENERNRQIEKKLKEEQEKIIFSAKNQEELEEKFKDELERLTMFAGHLIECIAERGNNAFAAFNETNINKGILAWDLGRLIIIARMCYDIGYIDEKTAWDIITSAYETAEKEFKDWRELAVSYLIGRGAWGGDTMMLDGLYAIAEKAFEDDNSPWKNVPLKHA